MKLNNWCASLCVASFVLSGCASKVVEPTEYSGFLADYSNLQEAKSPSGATVMRWIEPSANASNYTSVYIEPSKLFPTPQATEKIPQSTLDGITSYYDQALKREFSKVLPLAKSPGAGTLIVKPAITAVGAKTQGLHAYEVIPIALIAAGASTAAGIRDQDTTIATEAAFIDASDNHLVAQVVRKGAGQTLENSAQVMKASDAKAVLDGWASDMAKSFVSLKK
ncbi:MAG: DUF3313 domain-containing protein [Pseudomonas sp.]